MPRKILLLFFLMAGISAFAQTQEATTSSGKKVILYPDGTWKYAEEPVTAVKKKPEEKKKEPETKPVTVIATPSDCSDNLETVEDAKTGARITRTKTLIIVTSDGSGKEIGISLQKGLKGVITVTLRPVGAGECIAEGNKINIQFTDGSKLDMVNDGFTNCRGESTMNFSGPYGRKKQLDQLRSKKIRSIKVWTQLGSVQQELSPENQDQFLSVLSCLSAG